MANNSFIYNSRLNEPKNILNVGRTIIGKLKSKKININSSTFIKKAVSRTGAYLYKYTFKLYSADKHILKFLNKNTRSIKCFLKISPIESYAKYKMRTEDIESRPEFKETQLFKITNKLYDDNVLHTFVYSFNSFLLKNWSI